MKLFRAFNENETLQTIHRLFNSLMAVAVIVIGFQVFPPLYDEISGLKAEREAEAARVLALENAKREVESEIAQIVADEGYKSKPYKDSLGLWTVGFGHLIKDGETFEDLTPHKAVEMLRKDYANASRSVESNYPWATGEVRLVLINMTYQMGERGVSKFGKTIGYLESEEYDLAAGEMLTSRWAKQTPLRASRLAGRIMGISD